MRSNEAGGEFGTGEGGALYTETGVRITRSSFRKNLTRGEDGRIDGAGGAIFALGMGEQVSVEVFETTFEGNEAGSGGALHGNGTRSFVWESTLHDNRAARGGAVYLAPSLVAPLSVPIFFSAQNSTFSGNVALSGGAFFVHDPERTGEVDLLFTTLAYNAAEEGSGAAINESHPGAVSLRKSIVLGHPRSANCRLPLLEARESIEWPGTSCGDGSILSADALLLPLADNGGPTLTHALWPWSAARDAALFCTDYFGEALIKDQRGEPRPIDGDGDGVARCDLGAYEQQSAPRWPFHLPPGLVRRFLSGLWPLLAGAAFDQDRDLVPNVSDNCTVVRNTLQLDVDGDGYGNACDTDITNDRIVNFADLAQLKRAFFTNDPIADLNGDGVVDFADLAIMKKSFFKKPGPSGLVRDDAP